jgi:spore coat protein U-like protein
MTNDLRVVAAGLLCAALLAPPASARGCADFEIPGSMISEDYNPFSPEQVVRTFTISVRKLSEDANNLRFLLVDDDPRGSAPGFDSFGPADYDVEWLQDRSRRILVTGQQIVDKTNGIYVQLPEAVGRSVNVNFQMIVPRGQLSAPGEHRQGLTVRFSCYYDNEQLGAEYEQSDQRLTLSLSTKRFVSAYIGGIGRTTGRIDFGEISPTSGSLARNIAVTAIGTSPFDVRIESENRGQLDRYAPGGDRTEDRGREYAIKYAMSFGGLPVNSGQQVSCPVPVVPSGTTKQLEVILRQGDVSKVPAGNYRDTITLTFQPRDIAWRDGCALSSKLDK